MTWLTRIAKGLVVAADTAASALLAIGLLAAVALVVWSWLLMFAGLYRLGMAALTPQLSHTSAATLTLAVLIVMFGGAVAAIAAAMSVRR